MIHLITELSKYVMIILFAIYTWYSYVVLAVRNEERQKRMYKTQTTCMFLIHLDAFMVLFAVTKELKVLIFYGAQVLFVLFFVQRFLPRLFDNKIFYALALALPVALAAFSLYAGYVYNPEWPYERMALLLLSIALSGRFEIWHNVFWSAPLSLLGGLPTDGDEHHAIDNTFLAVPMNKGVLGAILVAAVLLLLLWRLAKKHRSTEVICLMALTLYLFMENKPFLLSANPFLLMLPVVFFNAEVGKAQSES